MKATDSKQTPEAVRSSAWLASFRGAKCRCGCGQNATHVMTGTEFGKPFPAEPCCYTAGSYCGECAAETGDEHALYALEEANS